MTSHKRKTKHHSPPPAMKPYSRCNSDMISNHVYSRYGRPRSRPPPSRTSRVRRRAKQAPIIVPIPEPKKPKTLIKSMARAKKKTKTSKSRKRKNKKKTKNKEKNNGKNKKLSKKTGVQPTKANSSRPKKMLTSVRISFRSKRRKGPKDLKLKASKYFIRKKLRSLVGQVHLMRYCLKNDKFARCLFRSLHRHCDKIVDSVRVKRKPKHKMSRAAKLREIRNRRVDLSSPESILTSINLTSIINKRTFVSLPAYYQFHLTKLLPQADQQIVNDNVICPTENAFNNEYLSRAICQFGTRLSQGKLTHESISKLKKRIEKNKHRIDPLKVKYFEPYFKTPEDQIVRKKTPEERHQESIAFLNAFYICYQRVKGYDLVTIGSNKRLRSIIKKIKSRLAKLEDKQKKKIKLKVKKKPVPPCHIKNPESTLASKDDENIFKMPIPVDKPIESPCQIDGANIECSLLEYVDQEKFDAILNPVGPATSETCQPPVSKQQPVNNSCDKEYKFLFSKTDLIPQEICTEPKQPTSTSIPFNILFDPNIHQSNFTDKSERKFPLSMFHVLMPHSVLVTNKIEEKSLNPHETSNVSDVPNRQSYNSSAVLNSTNVDPNSKEINFRPVTVPPVIHSQKNAVLLAPLTLWSNIHEKNNCSPISSPVKLISPIKSPLSPGQVPISSPMKLISPLKNTLSPEQVPVLTPMKTISPLKNTLSPGQVPISSPVKPNSPLKNTLVPGQIPISPLKNTLVPGQIPISPLKNTLAPRQVPISPSKNTASNSQVPISTSKNTLSHGQVPISTSKNTASPWQVPISPSKNTASPWQIPISPSKNPTSHSQVPISPSKNTASYRQVPIHVVLQNGATPQIIEQLPVNACDSQYILKSSEGQYVPLIPEETTSRKKPRKPYQRKAKQVSIDPITGVESISQKTPAKKRTKRSTKNLPKTNEEKCVQLPNASVVEPFQIATNPQEDSVSKSNSAPTPESQISRIEIEKKSTSINGISNCQNIIIDANSKPTGGSESIVEPKTDQKILPPPQPKLSGLPENRSSIDSNCSGFVASNTLPISNNLNSSSPSNHVVLPSFEELKRSTCRSMFNNQSYSMNSMASRSLNEQHNIDPFLYENQFIIPQQREPFQNSNFGPSFPPYHDDFLNDYCGPLSIYDQKPMEDQNSYISSASNSSQPEFSFAIQEFSNEINYETNLKQNELPMRENKIVKNEEGNNLEEVIKYSSQKSTDPLESELLHKIQPFKNIQDVLREKNVMFSEEMTNGIIEAKENHWQSNEY